MEENFEALEMMNMFGHMVKLVEIGLQRNMKPNEVVEYAISVFNGLDKEISKIERGD